MSFRDFGLVISLSAADDAESPWLLVDRYSGLSIQTQFGDVTGTLTLEGRDHETLDAQAIDEIAFTQPAGAAGGELFEIGNLRTRFVRVTYVHGSGTGELRVAVHAKNGGL